DLGVLAQKLAGALEYLPHRRSPRLPREAEYAEEADPVALGEGLDAHVGELAVGHGHQRPFQGADAGRAQADRLHVPEHAVDAHEVTHAEGPVDSDGDRAEEVL